MSLPPDDLERLVNLRVMYLNGNKVSSWTLRRGLLLPGDIISVCPPRQLQTLPAELGKIKKLYALDVGSNTLKYNIANWPYDWNW